MQRHTRSRRLFVSCTVVLIATLAAAALVFREGIHEQWLLWRLDHSNGDAEKACIAQLGTMGSLRAIEPLARRLEGLPASQEWHFYTTENVMRSVDALSALLSIAQAKRERSIPYLMKSSIHGTSPTSKAVFDQLVLVARGKQASIDLGKTRSQLDDPFPLSPGRDPRGVGEE